MRFHKYILFVFFLSIVLICVAVLFKNGYSTGQSFVNAVCAIFPPRSKSEPVVTKNHQIIARGNQLVRADGKPFIMRGVTSSAFRREWPNDTYKNVADLTNRIDTVISWGTNTVQLYLDPDLFGDTEQGKLVLADLKHIVDWGLQKDIMIILNPVNDVTWDTGRSSMAMRSDFGIKKRDDIQYFLAKMAKEFCSYPNVIFGLEAEPKFVDSLQTIHDRVLAVKNCQNPILIPMVNFSGTVNFEKAMRDSVGTENVILDYHPYKGANLLLPGSPDPLTGFSQIHVDETLYKRYPVIFGEFGGFWKSDFNTAEDLAFMTQVADFARLKGVGYVTYSLDDFGFSIFDEHGSLTARGDAIQKILSR